jgi:hypothetical protein
MRVLGLVVVLVAVGAGGLRAADRPPVPVQNRPLASSGPGVFARLDTLTVNPRTVSFVSSDPDTSGTVTVPATVSWNMRSGWPFNYWTLSVRATGAYLTGCPSIPVSAVQLTCEKVTDPWALGGGACTVSTINLSTTSQQIATGREDPFQGSYLVNLHFTFKDSWRYIATSGQTCSVDLVHTVDAP